MSGQPSRAVLLPTSRHVLVRRVLGSFGYLKFDDWGDRLLLHDAERQIEVHFESENGQPAGSDELPERLEFRFVGYSEEEADKLLQQYLSHGVQAA